MKNGLFSMNSQDGQLGKGSSLGVLSTFQPSFQTPLPSRKHMIVDYSKGQSVNSILQHYHEPRLNSHSNHISHSHNHNAF